MTEWRPIAGFDHPYEISDDGQVRHGDRPISTRMAKISKGYVQTTLQLNKKSRAAYIHRLMALAFLGEPPPGKPYACHINDDTADNRLQNLRWGSPSENCYDAVANGHNRQAAKTHCVRGHEFTEENTAHHRSDGSGRRCRQCDRDSWHQRKHKHRPVTQSQC